MRNLAAYRAGAGQDAQPPATVMVGKLPASAEWILGLGTERQHYVEYRGAQCDCRSSVAVVRTNPIPAGGQRERTADLRRFVALA